MNIGEILSEIGSGLAAVGSVALAYGATMVIYFFLNRSVVHKRLFAETCVILFALVVSTVMRFAVLCASGALDGDRDILRTIYEAIGGFTFESAEIPEGTAAPWWMQTMFYGSVLYVGLVALSVISAHISYEAYSYCIYRAVYRIFLLNGLCRRDVYIFSSATEDTLLLANDIAKTYRDRDKSLKGRRCIIIFAGNELEPFDRKNEIHRAIAGHGYFYFSFLKHKEKRKEKSLVARLGLKTNFTRNGLNMKKRICIFAMKLNSKLSGEEAKNSDFVFDDMDAVLRRLDLGSVIGGNGKRQIIEYYILADEEINYEFYERRRSSAVSDFLEALRDENAPGKARGIRKKQKKALSAYLDGTEGDEKAKEREDRLRALEKKIAYGFQLHVFSEALLSSHDLVIRRTRKFEREDELRPRGGAEDPIGQGWEESLFRADEETEEYRVLVLGFGKMAQQAMNALFANTAYVDRNFVPSRFVADVYDRAVDERAGLFGYMHPLYHCFDSMHSLPPRPLKELDEAVAHGAKPHEHAKGSSSGNKEIVRCCPTTAHRSLYAKYRKMCGGGGNGPDCEGEVEKYMAFPYVCFHLTSCFDVRFMQMLDTMDPVAGKPRIRACIICFGNDEDNILMANAFIDDYKHDKFVCPKEQRGGKERPFVIYVHIRDEKNYSRLNWTDRDEEEFGYRLFVIPFGNRESIYCYRRLIDERKPALFNYLYAQVQSGMLETGEGDPSLRTVDWVSNLLENKLTKQEAIDRIRSFQATIKADMRGREEKKTRQMRDVNEVRQQWMTQPAFHRESNFSASVYSVHFAKHLRSFLRNGETDCGQVMRRLICLEKTRWCRYHMANGWTYASLPAGEDEETGYKIRRAAKEHEGLHSYQLWAPKEFVHQVYDFINVLCGNIQDEYDREALSLPCKPERKKKRKKPHAKIGKPVGKEETVSSTEQSPVGKKETASGTEQSPAAEGNGAQQAQQKGE